MDEYESSISKEKEILYEPSSRQRQVYVKEVQLDNTIKA